MNLEVNELITQISKEKNIPQGVVEETIKSAFAAAAKKYLELDKFVDVKINRVTSEISMQLVVNVVENYTEGNEEKEMLLDEAREIEPEIEVGDQITRDITQDEFGRTIILTIKQSVVQRIRELERRKIFEDYKDRVGDLITGSIQQVDRGIILVNLGRTEAIIPQNEQIRGEKYRQGDTVRAYVLDVDDSSTGAQVILSRTHPQFLVKLFELEVPEIYDKIVEIKGVARDPGKRAKIAVYSRDDRIDPVGSCVGMKGNRVQAIVRELSGERIDIVHWNENFDIYVKRSFHPSEVKKIYFVGDNKIVAIVEQEDLAQAIGKSGQNIRLVSKLLKKQIDVFGSEDFARMSEEEREQALTKGIQEGEGEVTVAEADISADESINNAQKRSRKS
jgi:N utilization substance protein A